MLPASTRLQNILSGKNCLSRTSSPRPASPRKLLSNRIQEVLRHIEPVKDAITKVQAMPPPEPLVKALKALLFKIDYVEEGLLSLVEENKGTETEPKVPSKLFADIRSRRSDASEVVAKTAPKIPPAAKAKAPPPAAAAAAAAAAAGAAAKAPPGKKAPPPPAGKKAPPPAGKKPPPTKAAVPKLPLEEIPRVDSDLMPDTLPSKTKTAKPVQWQGLTREKIVGSVWEDLLKRDKQLITVRDWRQRYELACVNFPDSNQSSTTVSLPFLSKDEPRPEAAPDFRFEVEFKALDNLFFEDEEKKQRSEDKKASLAEAAAAAAKRRLYSVLDEKRTQNVEISLKGLGLRDDFTPIRNAICNLQFDSTDPDPSPESSTEGLISRRRGLKAEDLSLLLGLYPKEEDEIKKLKRLMDDPPADQKIAPAERFLLCLLSIPRFKPRVEAILSQLTFRTDAVVALDKAQKLAQTTEIAVQSVSAGLLRALLALVVKMGNYINFTTKKPVVPGIPVSALESLKSVKSLDGTKTFVRVVADHIEEQYPSGWRQLEWLDKCGEAADLNVDDLGTMAKSLQTKIDKIRSEMDYAVTQNDQKFIQTFGPFLDEAQLRVDTLKDKLNEVNKGLMQLAKLFADRAKTPKEAQDILRKLDHFGKDLLRAKKDIDSEKAAAERKRMRESLKDRTPLASRPSKVQPRTARKDESVSSTPMETSPPILRTRPQRTTDDGAVTPALPLRHHRSSVGRTGEDSPPLTLKRALNGPESGVKVASKTRSKITFTNPGENHLTMSMNEMTPTSERRRSVKPSPSIISSIDPRLSSQVETESTATELLRAKHKKSRSHALHKSVCSIQDSLNLSPKNQCQLPSLHQVPSFIAEDNRVLREVKSFRHGSSTTSKRHSTGSRLLTSLESQPARSNEALTSPGWYEYPSASARGLPTEVVYERPTSHRSARQWEEWEEFRRAEELARRSAWRQQQMYFDARHYMRRSPDVTGWPLFRR